MFGRDQIDGMGQRRARQIRIEQRHHAPGLSDAQPARHKFRPVPHQQADAVTFADALRDGPSGILIRASGELTVAEALALGQQGRRIRELRRTFLNHPGENAIGTLGDGRSQLQSAGPGLRGRFLAFLGTSFRHAVLPASTVSTVPVMFFDLQPSRNSTAFATSSTSARRFNALRRTTFSRCSPVSD